MNTKKGFTLIELLVVIAIIGLMSSVVLASLNSARGKAANAAVKANLRSVMAQAALFYDSNLNYGAANGTPSGPCSTPAVNSLFHSGTPGSVSNLVQAAISIGDSSLSARCNSSDTLYAVVVPLKVSENGNLYWCVDSAGASKGVPPLTAVGLSCPS